MSQAVGDKVKVIQEKLQQLLKDKNLLQKENQSLKIMLEEAKQNALNASNATEALQHQLDAKRYGQALMPPEEKKAFEKKITGYIKEIDKCINLLKT